MSALTTRHNSTCVYVISFLTLQLCIKYVMITLLHNWPLKEDPHVSTASFTRSVYVLLLASQSITQGVTRRHVKKLYMTHSVSVLFTASLTADRGQKAHTHLFIYIYTHICVQVWFVVYISLYHTWVWNHGICRCVIMRPRSHMMIVRRKNRAFKTIKCCIFLDSVAFCCILIHLQMSRNYMALNSN